MNILQLSRYTFPFRSKRGEYFVYNSRTNLLIKTTKDLYDFINNFNIKDTPQKTDKEILDKLVKSKILIEENDDNNFLFNLEINHNIETYSINRLILVIAPTSACNFDCPYCFEKDKSPRKMSDDTINNVINFVKEFRFVDSLHLTWYGGEPLLAISTIEKILRRLKHELPSIKVDYHFIVTNGYLINSRVINLFKEFPLNEIQITLDGEEQRHNNKRKLKYSGKGSYDKIIENIDLALNNWPETKMSIRVNIDKNNSADFKKVRESLLERWNNHKNIVIYPGILRIEDEENKCMGCESLLHDDIRALYYELEEDVNFYPNLCSKGCSATHVNSYVIGPDGEMYKCWNDMGDIEKTVGYIDKKELINPDLFNKYIVATSCFKNEECINCFYLPICMGGCAWYRLKNLYEGGKFDLCSLYKGDGVLEKCLELHYNKKTLNNEKY